MALNNISTIFKYRELIANFVLRDLKSRYKGSILGYLWTLLNPLLLMLVYVLVFSVVVRIKVENYPIFILTGILPWSFFTGSINRAMLSIKENANLMMKIYFPREIFPVSSVITGIVDFLLSLIVLIPFLFIYKIGISSKILLLPGVMLLQIALVLGISLFLSCLTVYSQDIANVMTVIFRLWFYLTPILYPYTMVPERFQFYYLLNPMAIIVYMYRWSILGMAMPEALSIYISISVSIILLIVGYRFFSARESDIIKRV